MNSSFESNGNMKIIKYPQTPKIKKKKKSRSAKNSRLQLTEFIPIPKICYCYFVEKNTANSNTLGTFQQNTIGINYASDIQRFYYYPGTKEIFTFLGFQNQQQLKSAIGKLFLKSIIQDDKIYIFSINTKHELNDCIKNIDELELYNINNNYEKNNIYNHQNSPINAIYDDNSLILEGQSPANLNKKIEILSKNEKNIQYFPELYLSVLLLVDDFDPLENIFYCFFDEKTKPDSCITSKRFQNKKINTIEIVDLQRFCYLENKHQTYTFFGFSTETELFEFIIEPSIKSLSTKGIIYLYYNNEIVNFNNDVLSNINSNKINDKNFQNKDKDSIKEFVPINDTYYIYFAERKKINPKRLTKRTSSIREIKNSSDVQRYSYYPGQKIFILFLAFYLCIIYYEVSKI